MVDRRRSWPIVTLLVAGVVMAVWVIARMQLGIADREHTAAISLKTALGVYRDRNGAYPVDLRDIESTLREITNADCHITETSHGTYSVTIIGETRVFEVIVAYSAQAGGDLEQFHVQHTR